MNDQVRDLYTFKSLFASEPESLECSFSDELTMFLNEVTCIFHF